MPSTFSPNKLYELQATGENDGTWGVIANSDFSIIDLNLGGRLNLDVSGSSNVNLTTTQARNVYHHLTGTLTGNIDYIFPASNGGFYVIKNATSGAFTLTVKPSGGTGISVPQGTTVLLFIDPDQTSAVPAAQPLLVSGGGLEYSSGALQRSALTGDVTASAGSNATTLGIVTTRGDIIYRNATVPARLAIGAANTVLSSDGTDPSWGTVTALLDALFSSSQGAILYRGASAWAGLAPGTNGQFLQTQGAGANPQWATVSVVGSGTAKTWAYVTVSGGTPSIAASFNITSITDGGVGELTITIATDFSSGNWAGLITCTRDSGQEVAGESDGQAAGSIDARCYNIAGSALADPLAYSFVGFGAQ